MSVMVHKDQRGTLNALLIPLILAILFLLAAIGFGYWAFTSRQDYKDNTDQKIAAAVEKAKQETLAVDAKNFAEAEKKPLRTYAGPSAFGSVQAQYPKTWSAYVALPPGSGGGNPVDGYFHPAVVPNVQNQNNTFALRLQVVQQGYDQVLSSYKSLVQANKVSVESYALPKLPDVVGVKITGEVRSKVQGTMIVLPLRSQTLKVWTESNEYVPDFNNNVLPNLTFSP